MFFLHSRRAKARAWQTLGLGTLAAASFAAAVGMAVSAEGDMDYGGHKKDAYGLTQKVPDQGAIIDSINSIRDYDDMGHAKHGGAVILGILGMAFVVGAAARAEPIREFERERREWEGEQEARRKQREAASGGDAPAIAAE